MTSPQPDHEPARINAEGELVGGVFCEYCGGLNRTDIVECEHCHEHIADQGPDLRSRLQRIHRRASSSEGFSDIADGGIGSVTGRSSAQPSAHRSNPLIESLKIFAGPGAILFGALFLLSIVAFLTTPSTMSWQKMFITAFLLSAALFCTVVGVIFNTEKSSPDQGKGREIHSLMDDHRSARLQLKATRPKSRLAPMFFANNWFLTVIALFVVFALVILVFGLVLLPLAR